MYHNAQQKQSFTAKLQLFRSGIILGFIQAPYRSEFLFKTIFWKQNMLSSSSCPENSAHSLFPPMGITRKTTRESCSEGKNKAKRFRIPQHRGTKLDSITPEPGPCSGPAPPPSLQGCARRGASPRAKAFRRAPRKPRSALVKKQTRSARLQKPGHPAKMETKAAGRQPVPGQGLPARLLRGSGVCPGSGWKLIA